MEDSRQLAAGFFNFFRGTMSSAIPTSIGVTTQPLPSQETAVKKLSQNGE
jgi:hypothetical protein